MRPLANISIPYKASIREICAAMKQALGSGAVGAALGFPYLSHEPLMDCGGPVEPSSFFLSEVYPSVLLDDCESSTHLASEVRQTLADFPGKQSNKHCSFSREEYTAVMGEALQTWPIFKAYTPQCIDIMSRICYRARDMLHKKALRISSVVGMSSEPQASADSVGPKASPVYGGHCFNVGRFFHPDGRVDSFLLEGTAPMQEIHVESLGNAIRLNVKVLSTPSPGAQPTWATQSMLFHEYLTLLGRTVCHLTQVINTPNGGIQPGGGVPVACTAVTRGWLSSTVFSPSLKSDRGVPMNFYHRVIYTGMGKDVGGIEGCLPVEQDTAPACDGFIAGCHPYSLSDMDLRGLDVSVPEDTLLLMRDVMNEAHPPLADHTVFRRLSDLWGECNPLVTVNNSMPPQRLKGCEYVRIACMETPAIPELCYPICQIKARVTDLANEINASRADTDHAYFVCQRSQDGSLKKEGTGCHLFVDVPVKSCTPTIVHSLRSALKRLDFPGYIPMGDEI